MYLIGYDIGSSSIKASIVEAASGKTVATVKSPEQEMNIIAKQEGWAEQHPETWWKNICTATKKLLADTKIQATDIKAIGIAYQMHGLVVVDKNQQVLRPSIIWCDSRAVEIGDTAYQAIGKAECLSCYLNSPGNFTASKLKWVKENEPKLYAQIDKIMLPGDYIAMKLTGETVTTVSGLSEGILWDFKNNSIAKDLINHYGFQESFIPKIVDTFSNQGELSAAAAEATGLAKGTPVTYRAGDQPNNALCLNVLNPNEVAATGGTSGVVYGVVDKVIYDPETRVNSFAHVNHNADDVRIGVLLCINGAGIQYAWMKQQAAADNMSYTDLERMANQVAIGADGLSILPFGNGAERMLNNKNLNAHIMGINFNRHQKAHLYRAALEGIAFSFVYGMEVFKEMNLDISVMRVGNDNLFRSSIFSNTIATLANTQIEVIDTTGAVGAAKAAGVAVGIYNSVREAVQNTQTEGFFEPQNDKAAYQAAYEHWKTYLGLVQQ
jgi:xylulokinase